jgi:hypothetical protein
MNEPERVAKPVVEYELLGATMRYVEQQSAGEHDYDLILPGGTLATLEVTAAVDETVRATTTAIFSQAAGGSPVAIGECGRVWIVEVLRSARIKRVRREIGRHLVRLEAAGIEHFLVQDGSSHPPEVEAVHRDLSVRSAAAISASGPGRAYLQIEAEGSLIDPFHVNEAVASVAKRADNRRKLGASSTSERHLFVYIDETLPDAWISLCVASPGSGPLELPPEVTHVWAATHHFADERVVYWYGDDTGWKRHDQIPDPSPA